MEKTIIMVPHGKVVEIAKVLGISKAMVSHSLRGQKNNELAKKIRHVALEQYDGVIMKQVGRNK